jgi:hypothetical protein
MRGVCPYSIYTICISAGTSARGRRGSGSSQSRHPGELNKLAANVALGRDTAGVHWRSDGIEGLNLGEAVAVGVLEDLRATYTEEFGGFSLTKFDGTTMTL